MTRRTWFRVHSFTGVVTGLLLFVICWSGTFATVSYELDWLVTAEARSGSGASRASWGAIRDAVQKAYPDAEVTFLQAPRYSFSSAEVLVNLPEQKYVRVYVDPSSGQVLGAWSSFNVSRFFRSFHRTLFFPNRWGILIVSAFALTLGASLVAALVFYRRWWRRFFRFRRGGGRVFWSELHKIAGLWSLWFALVMVLTGLWYGVEQLRSDYFDGISAYVGTTKAAVHPLPKPRSDPSLPMQSLDSLMATAREARPDMDIRNVSLSESRLYVDGQAGHLLVRDRANQLHLDARTGEMLYDQRASDLPLYWRWSDTADPLHFGDFGGLWSKGVWFAFGLILSGLILTGTWLHAHRLARGAGAATQYRWPGTTAAIAVSLAVVGVSIPLGFHQARDIFGPTVDGMNQLPTLAPGVRAVIFGWTALTLGIIAAWVFLLWRPQSVIRGLASPSGADRRALNRRAGNESRANDAGSSLPFSSAFRISQNRSGDDRTP